MYCFRRRKRGEGGDDNSDDVTRCGSKVQVQGDSMHTCLAIRVYKIYYIYTVCIHVASMAGFRTTCNIL